jgi:hypothetical protein
MIPISDLEDEETVETAETAEISCCCVVCEISEVWCVPFTLFLSVSVSDGTGTTVLRPTAHGEALPPPQRYSYLPKPMEGKRPMMREGKRGPWTPIED